MARREVSFQGCVMWESCSAPRQLQEFHEGHLGMTKIKSLARMYSYVWWPCLERSQCKINVSSLPGAAPLQDQYLWYTANNAREKSITVLEVEGFVGKASCPLWMTSSHKWIGRACDADGQERPQEERRKYCPSQPYVLAYRVGLAQGSKCILFTTSKRNNVG